MTSGFARADAASADRSNLVEVDFRTTPVESAAPRETVVERRDFSGSVFGEPLLALLQRRPATVFRECRFDGADLRRAQPGQSRFESCSFEEARLDGWVAAAAEFVDCTFAGPLVGVTFHGKPWGRPAQGLDPARSINEFRGNDFRRAELIDCAFIRGINLGQQQWPEGDLYITLDRFHPRLESARLEILRWRDRVWRAHALELVKALAVRNHEQNDVIARRVEERSSCPAEIQIAVWEILARS